MSGSVESKLTSIEQMLYDEISGYDHVGDVAFRQVAGMDKVIVHKKDGSNTVRYGTTVEGALQSALQEVMP